MAKKQSKAMKAAERLEVRKERRIARAELKGTPSVNVGKTKIKPPYRNFYPGRI